MGTERDGMRTGNFSGDISSGSTKCDAIPSRARLDFYCPAIRTDGANLFSNIFINFFVANSFNGD